MDLATVDSESSAGQGVSRDWHQTDEKKGEVETMTRVSRCPKCDGRELHVGDRFAFADNVSKKVFFGQVALEEGLQTGKMENNACDIVITQEWDPHSKTLKQAETWNVQIVTIDDFERMLKDVCDEGAIPTWRNQKVALTGKKVLVLGYERSHRSSDPEVRAVFDAIEASGFEIGKQVRPSLGAVVVPRDGEMTGRAKLCQERGIPLYKAADFVALYGR